jgi:hypothetical protein
MHACPRPVAVLTIFWLACSSTYENADDVVTAGVGGQATGATKLVDGYNLDGTPFAGASLHLAAFVVGAGVGAMATPQHAVVRDESYQEIMAWGPLLGGSRYYNVSWSVLGALMLTGQFNTLQMQ